MCRTTVPFPNTVIPFDTLVSTFWSSIKLSSNMALWSHHLTTTIASRSSCSLAWSSAQTLLTVVKSDPIARTDHTITGLNFTVCIWLRDFKQTQLRQSLVVYLLWMFTNPLNICWPFGTHHWNNSMAGLPVVFGSIESLLLVFFHLVYLLDATCNFHCVLLGHYRAKWPTCWHP